MNFTVIALVLAAFLISSALFWRFAYVGFDWVERVFCGVFTTFLIMALTALGLTRLGQFGVPAVTVITTVVALVFSWIAARWRSKDVADNKSSLPSLSPAATVFLVAALCLLLWLYLAHPTYYMFGDADAGIYPLLAQYIAKTGGLNLHLQIPLSELQEAGVTYPAYPAIFSATLNGIGTDPTVQIPQFQHLLPAFAAIFFSADGIGTLVRTNAFIAVLGLLGFFVTARRVAGHWPALIGMIALGVNPAMVWNARMILTESLSMTILFGGLAFTWLAMDKRSWRWGVVAGIVLGCGVFDRIDACFAVLVVFGVASYAAFFAPKLRRSMWALIVGYAAASTLGYLDGYFHSFPYFDQLWDSGTMGALLKLNYGGLLLACAALLISHSPMVAKWFSRWIVKWAAYVGIALLTVWLVYSYFVRPRISSGMHANATAELSWYVSQVAYPLFLFGIYWICRAERWKYALPLLLLAACSVYVYTWSPHVNSYLIYETRRWVPYVIPMLMLFGVYGANILWQCCSESRFRDAATVCSALVVLYYVWNVYFVSKPFMFKSMLAGIPSQYQTLANTIRSHMDDSDSGKSSVYGSYVFSNNKNIAAYLTYAYDIPTLYVPYLNASDMVRMNGHLLVGAIHYHAKMQLLNYDNLCGQFLPRIRRRLPLELRNRCTPASLAVIRTGSDAQTKVGVKYVSGERLNAVNSPAKFSEMLGYGWYSIESWGVWSDGDSDLLIRFSPESARSRHAFSIKLQLRAFAASTFNPKRVVISIGAKKIVDKVFTDKKWKDVVVPIDPESVPSSVWPLVTVHVAVSPIQSPQELHSSDDPRLLGVGLRGVAFK